MLGNMPPLGGGPNLNKIDPHDLSKMMAAASKQMQVQEDMFIVCSHCGCELFLSPIRLAKTKVDFRDAVGLVHEPPRAYCFQCSKELPHDGASIKTKGDLAALNKSISSDLPIEKLNLEGETNVQ